jgi:two-component system phosphate regulon response regulator PhoB
VNSRVLLVEDSPSDQKIVLAALGKIHTVVVAPSIADAEREIQGASFDLVLLDVDLPDGNGFRFFSWLQSQDALKEIPVVFLTLKSETPDEVMGFSLGAEDYITKPVDPQKLRARLEARLRRIRTQKHQHAVVQNAGMRLDFTLQRAYVTATGSDELLDLTPLEFKLLAHFMRHEEHVFSRDQLIDALWGANTHVIDRTVDMHISNLRKKIGKSGYGIQSMRGVGYRLVKDGKE